MSVNKRNSGLRPATLFKKRLWHRCFPVNFAEFLRTTFLTKHLRATASGASNQVSENYYFLGLTILLTIIVKKHLQQSNQSKVTNVTTAKLLEGSKFASKLVNTIFLKKTQFSVQRAPEMPQPERDHNHIKPVLSTSIFCLTLSMLLASNHLKGYPLFFCPRLQLKYYPNVLHKISFLSEIICVFLIQ